MKNSKLSVTRIPWTKIPPTPNPKNFLFLLFLILLVPLDLFSQLDELAQEFQKTENEARGIADSFVGIVKTIAGVSVIIGSLVFLWLRDQQSDLTKTVGRTVIGIAIFFILLAVGDSMRSL